MSKYRDYSQEPVMRTLRLPSALWQAAKAVSGRRHQPVRTLLTDSVTRHLASVVRKLQSLGLDASTQGDHLVRLPLSPEVLARLREASDEVGVPAVRLLSLCLHRRVGIRRMRSRKRGGGTAAAKRR